MSKLATSALALVERMSTIEQELAKRKTSLQIEREFAQLWRCSEAEVRGVIKAVKARWREEAQNESREERREGIRNAYNDLYTRSLAASDFKTARGCLQDLTALDGLQDALPQNPLPILITQHQSPLDVRNQIRQLEDERRKSLMPQEYHADVETESE